MHLTRVLAPLSSCPRHSSLGMVPYCVWQPSARSSSPALLGVRYGCGAGMGNSSRHAFNQRLINKQFPHYILPWRFCFEDDMRPEEKKRSPKRTRAFFITMPPPPNVMCMFRGVLSFQERPRDRMGLKIEKLIFLKSPQNFCCQDSGSG